MSGGRWIIRQILNMKFSKKQNSCSVEIGSFRVKKMSGWRGIINKILYRKFSKDQNSYSVQIGPEGVK